MYAFACEHDTRVCLYWEICYTSFGSVSNLLNAVESYDSEANDHISRHTRRSAKMNRKAANGDAATAIAKCTERPRVCLSVSLSISFGVSLRSF